MNKNSEALVILSGGQDSTTCAAIAKRGHEKVHAITFNYNQRHINEIQAARKVAKELSLDSHEVIDLGPVLKGRSPLVSDNKVGQYDSVNSLPEGVEPTFVYGRNSLFLTIAVNRAAVLGLTNIYMGVCQEDFGGYWDCRQEFIDAISEGLSLGTYGERAKLNIITPLMNLNKAETVQLAYEILGEHDFKRIMEVTHTCYNGVLGGCGKCHACLLRQRGFEEAGIEDPIRKL